MEVAYCRADTVPTETKHPFSISSILETRVGSFKDHPAETVETTKKERTETENSLSERAEFLLNFELPRTISQQINSMR